jgi:hypothetical protein
MYDIPIFAVVFMRHVKTNLKTVKEELGLCFIRHYGKDFLSLIYE